MAPRFVSSNRAPSDPVQARSIARREHLLDAAERLFAERGYDGTSIGEIVQAAHVSVGTFYNRFADKAEIFSAVQARFVERMLAMWSRALDPARWKHTPLAEIVRGVITDLAAYMGANASLIRFFAARAIVDDEVGARGMSVSRFLAESLVHLLLRHQDQIHHPDPALAIQTGLRMVFATLQQTALYGPTAPTPQPDQPERLAQELARAFVAYLTTSDAGMEAEGAASPENRGVNGHH